MLLFLNGLAPIPPSFTSFSQVWPFIPSLHSSPCWASSRSTVTSGSIFMDLPSVAVGINNARGRGWLPGGSSSTKSLPLTLQAALLLLSCALSKYFFTIDRQFGSLGCRQFCLVGFFLHSVTIFAGTLSHDYPLQTPLPLLIRFLVHFLYERKEYLCELGGFFVHSSGGGGNKGTLSFSRLLQAQWEQL